MRRTVPLLATVALTLLVASGLALVAGVGSATADSSVVGPGESIQKAINAAPPGDTVLVRGVHREDVVIRKNGIKLRGEDDAVIEAPSRAKADSPCSKFSGTEGICVLGDVNIQTGELTGPRISDVSVSGFTLRGFDSAGQEHITPFTIDVYGGRNTSITGNRSIGNVAAGIGVTVRSINTAIANNDVLTAPRSDTKGIGVDENNRNTKIVNNTIRSSGDGIDANGAIDTTIANNDVRTGADFGGIVAIESRGTKILSNTAGGHSFTGIFVVGPQGANAKPVDAKVVGNEVSGVDFGMVLANAQGGSITANEVHDNCAGMAFFSNFGPPSADFEVQGNTVTDNTRKCPEDRFGTALSGLGIGLFGTRGMEVRANNISGNVPSIPKAVSGGVMVGVDPLFGGTRKPKDNSVVANNFGNNRPDIRWDGSGSGNVFSANNCDTSVPTGLCN
jgi:parallel beta-helix repeat protein